MSTQVDAQTLEGPVTLESPEHKIRNVISSTDEGFKTVNIKSYKKNKKEEINYADETLESSTTEVFRKEDGSVRTEPKKIKPTEKKPYFGILEVEDLPDEPEPVQIQIEKISNTSKKKKKVKNKNVKKEKKESIDKVLDQAIKKNEEELGNFSSNRAYNSYNDKLKALRKNFIKTLKFYESIAINRVKQDIEKFKDKPEFHRIIGEELKKINNYMMGFGNIQAIIAAHKHCEILREYVKGKIYIYLDQERDIAIYNNYLEYVKNIGKDRDEVTDGFFLYMYTNPNTPYKMTDKQFARYMRLNMFIPYKKYLIENMAIRYGFRMSISVPVFHEKPVKFVIERSPIVKCPELESPEKIEFINNNSFSKKEEDITINNKFSIKQFLMMAREKHVMRQYRLFNDLYNISDIYRAIKPYSKLDGNILKERIILFKLYYETFTYQPIIFLKRLFYCNLEALSYLLKFNVNKYHLYYTIIGINSLRYPIKIEKPVELIEFNIKEETSNYLLTEYDNKEIKLIDTTKVDIITEDIIHINNYFMKKSKRRRGLKLKYEISKEVPSNYMYLLGNSDIDSVMTSLRKPRERHRKT